MIEVEQLAAALRRLDARDCEVLEYSLRRRVPDEALARVYSWEPRDVARQRASAIERLSQDLGVQRGEDLGALLQALLEPETWALVRAAKGPAPAPEAPAPSPRREAPEVPPPPPTPRRQAREAPPPPPTRRRQAPEPVLDMLSPRSERPPPPPRRPPARVLVVALGGLAAVVGAGALLFGGDDSSEERGAAFETRPFVPREGGEPEAPFPSDSGSRPEYVTATVSGRTALHTRPGGPRRVRIGPRTEFRSPRVLHVVRQQGRWLAVLAPELRNGEVAWLPAREARLGTVDYSLHADLSRRELVVRRDGQAVRRLTVAIGRARNPTPQGRFAVTDRLKVSGSGSPYGCCVLALTGHQTRVPPDWPGGDRLAIHATRGRSGIGKPVSLGCLRATSSEARWLIEKIPLGTPVFVRS